MTCLQNQQSTRISCRRGIWFCLFLSVVLAPASVAIADDKDNQKPPVPAPPEGADPQLLEKFLRDLFTPDPNGNRPLRDLRPSPPLQRTNDPGGSRDPIDNRAPRDAKIEQLLQAADTAVKQKNWKSAVDLYQRLLDQPDDSLHRIANGRWQSVRQAVNEKFGQLPEQTLAEYRSQYGGLANQLLMDARRSGRTADYVSVATRFFHTTAGYEAAHFLASQHFDRSEFVLAARWFSELAASPAAIARQDSWLLQAAVAFGSRG